MVNLHNNKYSFATPQSDAKIYRISPALLDNKDDFTKASKDIITSYFYISPDKQKEDIIKGFRTNTYTNQYEIWAGLSHQAITCFCALDNLSTEESANTFIDALYYIRLMRLYYGKTVPFLMINDKECKAFDAQQNTVHYLPTEEVFKKNLTEALKKDS